MPSSRTSPRTFTYIAVLAASLSVSACAGTGGASAPEQRVADLFDYDMQVIEHDTAPHAPAYGWRYFSDQKARRAVAISPQGDYYYSCGKGLHWVAAEQI